MTDQTSEDPPDQGPGPNAGGSSPGFFSSERRAERGERLAAAWRGMPTLSKAATILGFLSAFVPLLSLVAIPVCIVALAKSGRHPEYRTGRGFVILGLIFACALPAMILVVALRASLG